MFKSKIISLLLIINILGICPVMAGQKLQKAVFAGGCFWCMEPPFEKLKGVSTVLSGYAGGNKVNPTYEEVSAGKTGHTEVVEVTYDESVISYDELLNVFWRNIDPTTKNRQFVDIEPQYRTAIFFYNDEQKQKALKSIKDLNKVGVFKKAIVTEVSKLKEFYAAEEYHQDYYKKNPLRYKFYRYNSGRDKYLKKTWQK